MKNTNQSHKPSIGEPPLLPDSQLTWMVDDVTAANDRTGAFGGAAGKQRYIINTENGVR